MKRLRETQTESCADRAAAGKLYGTHTTKQIALEALTCAESFHWGMRSAFCTLTALFRHLHTAAGSASAPAQHQTAKLQQQEAHSCSFSSKSWMALAMRSTASPCRTASSASALLHCSSRACTRASTDSVCQDSDTADRLGVRTHPDAVYPGPDGLAHQLALPGGCGVQAVAYLQQQATRVSCTQAGHTDVSKMRAWSRCSPA